MAGPESVEQYFEIGCMRCDKGATPQCKVNTWASELVQLREWLLESGLEEKIKWSVPAYTINNKNVAMLNALKESVSISFFKGALVDDPQNLLIQVGENTQSSRNLKFKSLEGLKSNEAAIKAIIASAIEVEKKGLKVERVRQEVEIPSELAEQFLDDSAFETAFFSLTPGRQRAYLLHFTSAKQSKTVTNRINKWKPMILDGKGINDHYKNC